MLFRPHSVSEPFIQEYYAMIFREMGSPESWKGVRQSYCSGRHNLVCFKNQENPNLIKLPLEIWLMCIKMMTNPLGIIRSRHNKT